MFPLSIILFVLSFLQMNAPGEHPMDEARINALMNDIASCRIPKSAARLRMHDALVFLRKKYSSDPMRSRDGAAWCYPLEGYSPSRLGIRTRRAYLGAKSYDFYAGNAHAGHPAYDLFIRDRNQDDFDDRTGKPVRVLSVSGGVVICVKTEWTPDSVDAHRGEIIRGGKYVWVFDPKSDGLFYYAHLRRVTCQPGQRVEPGSALGEVGRSGKNAMMKRSGTHLHIMYLEAHDDTLRPKPIFDELVTAGMKRTKSEK